MPATATAPTDVQTSTHPGVRAPVHAEAGPDSPILLLFGSATSGPTRREEGFIAHALQRRHNHDTFRFRVVEQEARPDLFERFHVTEVPTLLVIDDKRVVARHEGLARPAAIEELLEPWSH